MKNTHLNIELPVDTLEQLHEIAKRRRISVDVVVMEMIEESLAEPTEEEIMENIRESLEAVKAGDVLSINDALAALKEEFFQNDH